MLNMMRRLGGWGVFLAMAVVVGLIGGVNAWVLGGDFRSVCEKCATAGVMPYNLVVLVLLGLSVRGWLRKDRVVMLGAVLGLALQIGFGNGYVASWLAGSLEEDYGGVRPLEGPDFDVVVVLGGGTTEGRNGAAQANWAGDRVLLAARLYHAGKARMIYCTGNRLQSISLDQWDPWEEATMILSDLGVPAERLAHVDGANTSQEMRSLAAELPAGTKVGIITSAFHMRRALRLARANGLDAVPLPCDFYTREEMPYNPIAFVPSALAAYVNHTAIKEYLARFVGR